MMQVPRFLLQYYMSSAAMGSSSCEALVEYVPGQIWLQEYPIRYSGCTFNARMTIVRLCTGDLWIHSPAPMSPTTTAAVAALGPVAHIVAPGTYHYFHVPACQSAFPGAKTWVCPGLDKKRPDLKYDGLLRDDAEPDWAADMQQVVVVVCGAGAEGLGGLSS